jgi:hypothetical protein
MATFIRADWNGVLESFENLIIGGGKRLLDQDDAQLSNGRSNIAIMLWRPRFVRVNEQADGRCDIAYGLNAREIELIAAKFEF